MANKRAGARTRPLVPISRGPGGRPTREEAAQRDERLIEVATSLFMERGFEATSIDAVAEAAGVSKQTVYAHYRDKRDLFATVLQGRIQRWLAPLSAAAEAQAAGVGPKDIETALHDLSRELLALSAAPGACMLHRILAAQAFQFPEIATLAYEEGWLRGIRAVASLLQKFAARGQIEVEDPEPAAEFFLSLVLERPKRLASYGITASPETHERWRQAAVELFLKGVKTR